MSTYEMTGVDELAAHLVFSLCLSLPLQNDIDWISYLLKIELLLPTHTQFRVHFDF